MSIAIVILIFVFVFRETLPVFKFGSHPVANETAASGSALKPESYDPDAAEPAEVIGYIAVRS